MSKVAAALVCGLLFGAGLSVSGMINPAKVLNFLDLAGTWDASLALVMAGAVAVTWLGYRFVLGRAQPLFEDKFSLPTARDLDARLLTGAAIFGLGWGLGGYCPGPALAGVGFGLGGTLIFVMAMIIGLVAGSRASSYMQSKS